MSIFARIAQMESSRIVGGRAQTQALLRAPNLSSRTAHDGGAVTQSGSRGVTRYYADSIPFPAGSIIRVEPPLKFGRLAQAVLDGLAVTFGLFFLAALFGSLPLAVALMIFGAF